MTTGKSIALTLWTFAGKVMSLLLNILSRFVIAFLPKCKHVLSYFTYTQIIRPMEQTNDNCAFGEATVAIILLSYFYMFEHFHDKKNFRLWGRRALPHTAPQSFGQSTRKPGPWGSPSVYGQSHSFSSGFFHLPLLLLRTRDMKGASQPQDYVLTRKNSGESGQKKPNEVYKEISLGGGS